MLGEAGSRIEVEELEFMRDLVMKIPLASASVHIA